MFFSQSEKLQVPNLYISLNMDEGQKREREIEKVREGGRRRNLSTDSLTKF